MLTGKKKINVKQVFFRCVTKVNTRVTKNTRIAYNNLVKKTDTQDKTYIVLLHVCMQLISINSIIINIYVNN